jgi:hypothetical protein
MFEKKSLADFLHQASLLIPESAANIRSEFERNLKPLVEKQLGSLNLVTREEFNAQLALVERLREQLRTLEAELAELNNAKN